MVMVPPLGAGGVALDDLSAHSVLQVLAPSGTGDVSADRFPQRRLTAGVASARLALGLTGSVLVQPVGHVLLDILDRPASDVADDGDLDGTCGQAQAATDPLVGGVDTF